MSIYTSNGLRFDYQFIAYKDVKPEDVSVFNYSGKPIVTLQTCSGIWNEQRRMFEFNFTGVAKA